MDREVLIRQIREYVPYNEQEEKDREEILRQLTEASNVFARDNRAAHMSASAWVVNGNKTKVLMAYHNIYDSWSWLGGHADGEVDLLAVALKEVREESGIGYVTPVSEEIYSLEILTVDGHQKNGAYVSSHLHLNVTYLLQADEHQPLVVKPDENSQLGWFAVNKAIEMSTEPWFQKNIYNKLNQKLSEA